MALISSSVSPAVAFLLGAFSLCCLSPSLQLLEDELGAIQKTSKKVPSNHWDTHYIYSICRNLCNVGSLANAVRLSSSKETYGTDLEETIFSVYI